MQPLNESTILITGATSGLGKKVALDLAGRDAAVLLHGRDPDKGARVLKEVREASGNEKAAYYNADLSSLQEVREFSDRVQADQGRITVLINNAGIGPGPGKARRQESRDGYELRFAVNYLAHYLLTHRLVPLMKRSTPARIINVASAGQQEIDFGDVMLKNGYTGLRAYMQSKLAMVMFTFGLAEELKDSGITVNSLHPATLMPTPMVKETDYFSSVMSTVAQGAAAVEHLAVSPALDGVTGRYYNGKKKARAISQAYDRKARERLEQLSRELTG
jgi:NAD(P)-dependent dehydrogenase (short-subunit alcohol dehydrogenase family)